MGSMNQNTDLRLSHFMDGNEGWGRASGRVVYGRLVQYVESKPGVLIFEVSLAGVKRVDISFASETVVELARRYRAGKGFCFVDLTDADMEENFAAAAERSKQPLMAWTGSKGRVVGPQPSQGLADAFAYAMSKSEVRASDYAASASNVSITNASTKFKQLWEAGYLLRQEGTAASGGVEFVYCRIR